MRRLRLDPDLKSMTVAELQQEVMRLRSAFRKELNDNGNRRCWVTLLQALPEGREVKPIDIPEDEFLRNCARYRRRNHGKEEVHTKSSY